MRKKWSNGLAWMLLIAAYLLSVGLYACYGVHNLNADMSSEMVLAELLNEEGRLLTPNWYYSTELRVVSAVPLYQLGLLLFDSWNAARLFVIAVLLAGVAGSFIFLMSGIGSRRAGIYGAAALVLPAGRMHASLFTYGNWYAVYFLLICLMLGILVRLGRWKGRRFASGAMLVAGASFFCGMHGTRFLMMWGLPAAAAGVSLMLCGMFETDSLKEWCVSAKGKMGICSLVNLAAVMAGYLYNTHVLAEKYSYTGYSGIVMRGFKADTLLRQIELIAEYFGYHAGAELMSAAGLTNLCILLLMAASAAAPFLLLGGRLGKLNDEERLTMLYTVCATACCLLLSLLTDRAKYVNHAAYYLTGMLLSFAGLLHAISKLAGRMRPWTAGWMEHVFLTVPIACVFLIARTYQTQDVRATKSDHESVAQWLTENGYENGFSTFWNGNILTELSDGKLHMHTFEYWDSRELYRWLQPKAQIEKVPEGNVFVYEHIDERTLDPFPGAEQGRLVYDGREGRIYEFESAEQVLAIQREGRGD